MNQWIGSCLVADFKPHKYEILFGKETKPTIKQIIISHKLCLSVEVIYGETFTTSKRVGE